MADGLSLYEEDFVLWAEQQAIALRSAAASGTNLPLDWDNLAEEIDSLGRSLRSKLRNRIATIIEHLFKLELSDAVEPRRGWTDTVLCERVEIETLLEDNPSLHAALPASLTGADRKARKLAELSFRQHGEWSPAKSRSLVRTCFSNNEVLGPWLPSRDS